LTAIPATPTPTATPFLHVLTKDDTLLGLAFRYGVSLEEILAANPGINPHFLTIGKTVVIPIKIEEPTALPTQTLIPLGLGTPHCYLAGDGGSWCVLTLRNDQAQPVENVSVWLGIFSASGENIGSQVVVPPLNLVNPGQAMPIMAYFAPPLGPGITARARLLTVLNVEKKAKRYLPVSLQGVETQIALLGQQAEARGQVELTGTVKASALWVLAVAYGEDGEIAGMRKWEAETDARCLGSSPDGTPTGTESAASSPTPAPAPKLPRKCQSFDLTVFSLGPVIRKVDILVEARP
jgi:LysM repeat protein